MKFKAVLHEAETLSGVAQVLAGVAKRGYIVIDPDYFTIIVRDRRVWGSARLATRSLFSEPMIESKANNRIHIEVSIDQLSRTLRTLRPDGTTMMKLTKRNGLSMLTFSVEYQAPGGSSNTVVHDINIRVLTAQSASELAEPGLATPTVIVVLPPLAQVAQIANNIRALSAKLQVEADMSGNFRIGATTLAVETSTRFAGLDNPILEDSAAVDSADAHASAKLDARELCMALRVSSLSKKAIACFVPEPGLMLYVYLRDDPDADDELVTLYLSGFDE